MILVSVHLLPPLDWEALEGTSRDFPLILCWQLILDICLCSMSPPDLSLTT